MKSTGLLVAVLMLVAVAGCASDKPPAHHGMDAGGDLGDAGAARDGSQAMLDADAATDASIDGSSDGITDAATHGGDVDAHLPTESDAGPASCRNGLTDRHETDIDCGGNECGPCLSGRHCELAVDCLSGKCESDGTCACKPLAACPAGTCGVIHNCGSELDCGNCAAGVCYENQCCSPRKCKTGECGVISDGCGGTLRCGDESCCTPRTCDHPSLENRCGDFDDRCGGTVTCSCGDAKTTCYLGECCSPLACKDMGGTCGIAVSNGCGGTVSCGCGSDEKCYLGECCKPLTDCSTWAGPGCG
ncbi:MAG TPA: hypothetical protein VHM19_00670, partial [Polyangiales bacterium]|nr:hypothetical protein [Polyangiales bacterium]